MDMDTSTPLKRCSKCGEEKPATLEYFTQDKDSKFGLYYQCKRCKNYLRSRNLNYQPRIEQTCTGSGLKRCTKCGRELPNNRLFFYINNAQCRGCRKKWSEDKFQVVVLRESLRRKGLKVCNKCNRLLCLNHDSFHRHSKGQDGFDRTCKNCKRDHYKNHQAHYAEIRKRWRENNLPQIAKANKDYKKRNIERIRLNERNRYQRNVDIERQRDKRRRLAQKSEKLRHVFRRTGFLTPALEYFHGFCAVCNEILSEQAKPVLWLTDNPSTSIPLCSRCISTRGDLPPKDWLIRRYGKHEAKEILRRIDEYFIWLKSIA